MKEDNGEELINLNEQGEKDPQKNEEKQDNKDKNKFINKKILFLLFSLLLILIMIIFVFLKLKDNQIKQKQLVIFDFDKTISLEDVFEEQRFLLPSKEEQEDLMERLNYENWTLLMSSFYERFYELNITISDINKFIDTVEYNKGMIELIQYLSKYKDKYSLVIISAGHSYQVNRMLERVNLTDYFDEIIAIPSYIENGKIIVTQGNIYNCDICNVGQCKTFEYNLLIDKYKKNKNIIFNKTYYICDGLNDFCLARNLKENDLLLVRKGFTLYKGLFEKGMIKNVTCKIDTWNDGFDIIKNFKEEG